MLVRIDTITGLVTSRGHPDTTKHSMSGDFWQVFLPPCHTEILGKRIHVREYMQRQNTIPKELLKSRGTVSFLFQAAGFQRAAGTSLNGAFTLTEKQQHSGSKHLREPRPSSQTCKSISEWSRPSSQISERPRSSVLLVWQFSFFFGTHVQKVPVIKITIISLLKA